MSDPDRPLILASGSPRRRDLMAEAGYAFEVVLSPAEELHEASMDPADLTMVNARLKAEAVAIGYPNHTVLGADTLVFLDGEPLGKPVDLAQAEEMLGRLVGRTHEVCTGVCLCRDGGSETFHVITRVTFKALSTEQIRTYLAMIDPLDKAGAYAAQEHGEFIIARVDGSWTNVVGLPMERLAEALGNASEAGT